MNNYTPTIGIEVHLELKTNAKVFSKSLNGPTKIANTNINEIDLGYPGTLPALNKEVVEKAIAACLGLNMNITKKMHFDRKNYYYPDLAKGYQITQAKTPIGRDGYLEIEGETKSKKIGISDIHIEEDTCKSLHHSGKTLLNYNRSGVPLIEIVSKPDMKSKEEAAEYASRLRELMVYLGVSDCKIEEGRMRFDVNVSVSKDNTLGVRSEIKNIGSISNIKDAIDYEVKRQINALENGEILKEDTRKYDETKKETVFMRRKEPDKDYRYFPEPDLPYLYLTDDLIKEIENSLELLPNERRNIYKSKNISNINIDKLISHKELSDYLNQFLDDDIDFQIASNILLGDIASYLNKEKVSIFETKLTKDKFITLVNSLKNEEISSKIFKDIIEDVLTKDIDLNNLLENTKQISSKDEILKIIKKVTETYKESFEEYKKGKEGNFKFLMGMVMKESKGKINPKIASEILKDFLDNSN